MTGLYVAIEGPTGAGKTTLAGLFAPVLDAEAVFDPFEANPFLGQLLAANAADEPLALRVELTFFALRIAQLRQIAAALSAGSNVVADWALLKQPVFAATTLSPADSRWVAATVASWEDGVPQPDVLIGLSAPMRVLRQRIRQRGRDIETGLTDAHLQQLAAAFDAAYATWGRPLIRLDATKFDALDPQHVHELAARVRQLQQSGATDDTNHS